jgi:hypothetical protein
MCERGEVSHWPLRTTDGGTAACGLPPLVLLHGSPPPVTPCPTKDAVRYTLAVVAAEQTAAEAHCPDVRVRAQPSVMLLPDLLGDGSAKATPPLPSAARRLAQAPEPDELAPPPGVGATVSSIRGCV